MLKLYCRLWTKLKMCLVKTEPETLLSHSETSALKIDSTLSLSSFPSGFLQLNILLLLNIAHILVRAMCPGAFDLIICGPAIVQI